MDFISNTQLNMMLSCGELYRLRYIERQPFPISTGLIKGIATHRMAEKYCKHMIDTGEILDELRLKALLVEEIDAFFQKDNFHYTREEQEKSPIEVRSDLVKLLLPIAGMFHKSMKDIIPVDAEARQKIDFPGLKRKVVYIIDVETIDNMIIDFKVSGKKKTQHDIDTDGGLTLYAYAYFSKHGVLPRKIKYFNYIAYRTKKKLEIKHDFQELETTRSIDDFNAIGERYKTTINGIEKGIYYPAETGHWKCNPDYCHNYISCPYIGEKRLLEDIY